MYRPNRIGSPHLTADVDKAIIKPAHVNFDALDNTLGGPGAFVLTDVIANQFMSERFLFTVNTTLAGSRAVGIGIPISGLEPTANHMFELVVSASLETATDLSYQVIFGRSKAAVSKVAQVDIDNPIYLPITIERIGEKVNIHTKQVLVQQSGIDGGVAPADVADQHPLVLALRIQNSSGGAVACDHLQGYIANHRYVSDFDTRDPNR